MIRRMKKEPEYYALVKKSLIRVWIVSTVILIVGIIVSFQYTNYVDRRSNELLCNLVKTQNQVYINEPPPSQTGKDMAKAINTVANSDACNR